MTIATKYRFFCERRSRNLASEVSGGVQYVYETAGAGASAVKGEVENTASAVRGGVQDVAAGVKRDEHGIKTTRYITSAGTFQGF